MLLRILKIWIVLFICSPFMLTRVFGSQQFVPEIERERLSNGLIVLVSEEHSLPVVTTQLLIDSGSRRDPPGKEGLANLTANGILLGTEGHSADAIFSMLDNMGADLTVSVEKDFVTLTMRLLSRDLRECCSILAEVLTTSTFPKEEIRREKNQIRSAIRASEDVPGVVARKAFESILYEGSPYSHSVRGTLDSLSEITRREVVEFYEDYFKPNNAILAIVGDTTDEEVNENVVPLLAHWEKEEIPQEKYTNRFSNGPLLAVIDRNVTQANIIIGHRGIPRGHPDYDALGVMNYILGGGGFSSRLFQEIRVERGLAYRVTSRMNAEKYAGSFEIVLQTKNRSANEAIDLSLQKMREMQSRPVSRTELEGAKQYLTGSFPLRLDTQRERAGFFAHMEYYDLGLDYPARYLSLINSVTSDDILQVAKEHLYPEERIVVAVADAKEADLTE